MLRFSIGLSKSQKKGFYKCLEKL